MKKIICCLIALLFLFPTTTFADPKQSQPTSIEISYINVTLNGQNINSGLVEVEPGQQLQLHIVFNYYGGKITNYPATHLQLNDGGKVQVLPNHFEKISDTQAAEDVIVSISPTVKPGDTIPVKFIITGPDIDSEEGETITFVIKENSSDTSSSTNSSSSSSSQTSSTESSTTSQTNSDSSDSTDSSSTSESSTSNSQSDSSASTSESTDSSSNSSSNDNSSFYSSNTDSNYKKSSDSTSGISSKNTTTYSTVSTRKQSFKLLPKTGMENSVLGWLGLGVTNIVAAIYLLRKK